MHPLQKSPWVTRHIGQIRQNKKGQKKIRNIIFHLVEYTFSKEEEEQEGNEEARGREGGREGEKAEGGGGRVEYKILSKRLGMQK